MVALSDIGEGSCCLPHQPWTVKAGGPSLGTDGIVFTVANPCGASVNEAAAETPLVRIARHGACVGGEGDGDLVLVRASVVALTSLRGPGAPDHVDPCGLHSLTAEVAVKLAIRACGLPEPVIIDSDSEVIVPAGPITIDVLAPAGWSGVNLGPPAPETNWTDLTLRVTACPCDCGYNPKGRLTETWAQDPAVAAMQLVRPRRARAVQAMAATAAGAASTATLTYRQRQAGTVMGVRSFPLTFPPTADPLLGASPVIDVQIAAGAGLGHMAVIWEIV